MANQLDIVGASAKKPFYDFIELSEFRPELDGRIRVRVNPTRAFRKRLDAANALRTELEGAKGNVERDIPPVVGLIPSTRKRIAELEKQDPQHADLEGLRQSLTELEQKARGLGEQFIALAAELIPLHDAGDDTTLTAEQLEEFLEGVDETDDTLQVWFMEQVWKKVFEYFLSPGTLRLKSALGAIPSSANK